MWMHVLIDAPKLMIRVFRVFTHIRGRIVHTIGFGCMGVGSSPQHWAQVTWLRFQETERYVEIAMGLRGASCVELHVACA